MDVRYINPFIASVQNVFKTMLKSDVTVEKPRLKVEPAKSADVSALIGYTGTVTGNVVLSFSMDVAVKIASAFASTPLTPEHPDFADALGELANMVAGSAKASLQNSDIRVSLPNVVIGTNHHLSKLSNFQCIVIPCNTQWGQLNIDVAIRAENKPAAQSASQPAAAAPQPVAANA